MANCYYYLYHCIVKQQVGFGVACVLSSTDDNAKPYSFYWAGTSFVPLFSSLIWVHFPAVCRRIYTFTISAKCLVFVHMYLILDMNGYSAYSVWLTSSGSGNCFVGDSFGTRNSWLFCLVDFVLCRWLMFSTQRQWHTHWVTRLKLSRTSAVTFWLVFGIHDIWWPWCSFARRTWVNVSV